MGIFNFLKKKKTVVPTEQEEREEIDFATLAPQERKKYMESQCEIIKECEDFIKDAKIEYKLVGAYFSDIQLIETLPREERDAISELAKRISDLSVDRRMYMAEESKVSPARYRQMARDEAHMVESIKKLQNDEAYQQVVKRDISALEGEKMSLRIAATELIERQKTLRGLTIAAIITFGILFLLMAWIGFYAKNNDGIAFMVILFLSALFLAADAAIYQKTIYDTKLTEKKLNKALTLLNRVKIKLFNVTNVIEYQYAKFDVKSSYDLAEQYQLYLEAKKMKESYRNATIELNELEDQLVAVLQTLSLHDANIWVGQVKALCDTKEMVEIRHGYSVRRQKLREQIEEGQKKSSIAKGILAEITRQYPSMAGEVMAVKEQYKIN